MRRPVLLLLAASAAAAPDRPPCLPSIEQGDTEAGGRRLTLTARPSEGCRCSSLGIAFQPRQGPDAARRLRSRCRAPRVRQEEAPPGLLRAVVTVRLAGWYFASCCQGADGGACYSEPRAEIWLDGIHADTWNVSVSPQQLPGDPPRLSVELTKQKDPNTELSFYFPDLFVSLHTHPDRHHVETATITNFPANKSYVFGRSKSLTPGEYRVEVKPRDLNCPDCFRCFRARYVTRTITPPGERPSAVRVEPDPTTSWTVYIVLGVLAGLALVALVVFLGCGLLRGQLWLRAIGRNAQVKAPPSPPAPAASVRVLLLHRGGGGEELDQLRAALRGAGITLFDCRDRSVLNLFHTYCSPADLLALEAFREARLLFLAGDSDPPLGAVTAQMYDSVLRFVRNGRLGLDYGRVFTATLGDGVGDELVGLVEGRLFRVPADLPLLVEHILAARRPAVARLSSTESRTGLLPGMEGEADPQTPPV